MGRLLHLRFGYGPPFILAENRCQYSLGVVVQRQCAEAWYSGRVVKVPGILGKPDEVADRGVRRPCATKGGTSEVLRNARRKEGADVGCRTNFLERRQICQIQERFPRTFGTVFDAAIRRSLR